MLAFATRIDLRAVAVLLGGLYLAEKVPGHDFGVNIPRRVLTSVAIGVIACRALAVAARWLDRTQRQSAQTSLGPVREKKTGCGTWLGSLGWASCEMQGWRPAMEDFVSIVVSMPDPVSNLSFFAVFDGHGGKKVSSIASGQLPKLFVASATGLIRSGGATPPGLMEAAGLAPEASDSSDDGVGSSDDSRECHERVGDKSKSDEGIEAVPNAQMASACATSLGTANVGDSAESSGGVQAESIVVAAKIVQKALYLALLTLDEVLRKGGAEDTGERATAGSNPPESHTRNLFDLMGSTAIIAVLDRGDGSLDTRPRRVTIANCGDSRAVLCRNGVAVELSIDHKPELPAEEERICKAGGHVAMLHPSPCHRVDGVGLNLSRALGDFHYKARLDLPSTQQKVIAAAEVSTVELSPEDEFILLACDGVFELNTSQDVVDLIKRSLDDGVSLDKVVEQVVEVSCTTNPIRTHGLGTDNCSAVVIRLR
eukprot:TRINITY_DN3663_c0_g2_i1.p1 TRINITY_DN3663_c0_g2~~TRINITY_DN3663_c0_g2_i1.p1  ORF type:complete len:510 (-),score=67.72 TRINITY_DN3663_c0_g2_i1:127-1575(-)